MSGGAIEAARVEPTAATGRDAGPPRRYGAIVRLIRLVLHRWFRRIEVQGLEHVPDEGGGIFVAWHPNGLLDPALILAASPRPVAFGARHGLFRIPGLGWLLRGLGVCPIVRAHDVRGMSVDERRAQNERALDALAQAIVGGSFACLFPEGDSHDAPHLLPLKTGAARIFERARALVGPGETPPVVVPVGLHYAAKRSFRTHALVSFHPPVAWSDDELCAPPPAEAGPEARRDRARRMTADIERVLRTVVRATESWRLHYSMHRARSLVRAERAHRVGANLGAPDMVERTLGFARVWEGYEVRRAEDPAATEAMVRRVGDYDDAMRALGLEDHELDRNPRLRSRALLLAQMVGVFVLAPPVLVVGYLVNLPAVIALSVASRVMARRKKDVASIKVLLGAVLLPASWTLAGLAAWRGHRWIESIVPGLPDRRALAAAIVVAIGIGGGMLAVRYWNVARDTARAVRVRLTRARRTRCVARLRRERAAIHDALMAMAQGLELPGRVDVDGRVVEI